MKEDKVQKSHFSEDEVLMTTQVKNYSKFLLFRSVSLLMIQPRSRLEKHVSPFPPLSFKQLRNCPRSTMASCSHEVSDDISIGFSGGRICFPEPNLPVQAYMPHILNWKLPPQ